MRKLVAYLLTPIHLFVFGLLLGIFHPLQWIAYKIGGFELQRPITETLNIFLIYSLTFLGCRVKMRMPVDLPTDKPVLIISNHQSMYDIPAVVWMFKKKKARFVSKKTLGKGLPSISIYLRNGNSALIDRKDSEQSVKSIASLGSFMKENKIGVCIFPEGTRAKDGVLKSFKINGIKTLLEQNEEVIIVPLCIKGNYLLHQYGKFPMGVGYTMEYTALPSFSSEKLDAKGIADKARALIVDQLGH